MTEISVCISTSCHLKGSYNIIQTFQQLIEENSLHDTVDVRSSFCMDRCELPGVKVNVGDVEHHIAPEDARTFFKEVVLNT